MAFQVSPGVEVKEIDATNVIPAVSTSIGGTAGHFRWGPIDKVISVSSEKQLAEEFGTPNDTTAEYFFPAAGFLKYGQELKVVRASGSSAVNAASGTALLIKNEDELAQATLSSAGDWVARYAGTLGNSITVSVCTSAQFAAWTYATNFDSAPGTSPFAETIVSSNVTAVNGLYPHLDEIHVIVIDNDGAISGTKGTILETFSHLSQATNAKKSDGTTNYYKEVINQTSEWIYFGHTTRAGGALTTPKEINATSTAFAAPGTDPDTAAFTTPLTGGVETGSASSDIVTALGLFDAADIEDVNLLFAAGDGNSGTSGETEVNLKLIALAGTTRKDCVAFVSPPVGFTDGSRSIALSEITTYFGTTLGTNSSYVVADSSSLKVYDKYNDVYRHIMASGHIAGLCANTDRVAAAWFSPAGETRGQLLGVTKLGFNPKKTDRDTLYKAGINPLVSLPGRGTLLFGDKTTQNRASAFDRINVRRLFIVLEKAISTASEAMLFEFNDEFTRANFRNMVEPFLRDVKGRRGITDFLVICDETNNTGNIIDQNKFVADIFIKPARSINFITLNFIATRTGVEFSEIAGQ